MIRSWSYALGLVISFGSFADVELPSQADSKHMGVASCASSTCHGSVTAFANSNVQQNEFSVWQSADPHATAYDILLNDQSKRIARNLGLKNAHEADMCLDCHADNVAAAQQGDKFQISDGVGCEACHGGAEQWLSSHASGQMSHQDNLDAGLYPTEDPKHRAALCLSCHQGNPDQMITHRIMGAGHPRLSFELDTFTWMNPHFVVDEDYVERKGALNGAKDWSVGQGMTALTQLQTQLDPQAGWDGIFPELVLFDCHACHRSMSANKWVPRASTGLPPGIVRFNDANLLMFRHVVGAINPSLAESITDQTKLLHRATTKGQSEYSQAARKLLESVSQAVDLAGQASYDKAMLQRILNSVVSDGKRGQYRDYAAAEQASMAVDTILLAFENSGALDADETDRIRLKADGLFQATKDEDNYSQNRFVNALQALEAAIP